MSIQDSLRRGGSLPPPHQPPLTFAALTANAQQMSRGDEAARNWDEYFRH
jgi:hypothetical protein